MITNRYLQVFLGKSHPVYHGVMFVIASSCLGLLIFIARRVSELCDK